MSAPLLRWRVLRVPSGGDEIYAEVTGDDGPVVLLGHGAGGSHAAWFQQVPALAAAGYRVVTWDTRGFGNSTFRSGVHGAAASVADMTAVLDASAVGSEPVHVVGQSMGGWWVTAFALAHPERTRSLVLCNTIGGLWTDALSAHFREWAASLGPEDLRLGMHPALGSGLVLRDPARAFLYQQLNTFHDPPMAAVMGALNAAPVAHADVDALGIPILVITGTDDALFPAPLVLDSAAQLAQAETVEIPDAGHSPYFERPDEFNAALLAFLTRV